MSDMSDKDRGLYAKYRAFKLRFPTSEVIDPGMEVTEPFFLLKIDANDQHARRALLVYAASVMDEGYFALGTDILKKLNESRQLYAGDELDAQLMEERAKKLHKEINEAESRP